MDMRIIRTNENSGITKAVLGPKGDLSFQKRLKDLLDLSYLGLHYPTFFKNITIFLLFM
jgi:hypothetical protein